MPDSSLTDHSTVEAPPQPVGPWTPLRFKVFRWLWLAALFSNIGTWVQEVAAGWLMTDLSDAKFMVALVQAATMGPVFLLSLPAGALADIIDRRRLLLFAQAWSFCASGLLAALAFMEVLSPWVLLLLVSLLAIGAAIHMPAFQAIVPELVPRTHLKPAVMLNGVAINVARAIGPALAGVIISLLGVWAAFAINAVTFVVIFLVLFLWRREPRSSPLPPEQLFNAILLGLRYARHDRSLQVVLARSALFMVFASSVWALLPVIVRHELDQGAAGYGIALTAVGFGAVSGVFLLPRLRGRMSTDQLAVAAAILYACGMFAMAYLKVFILLVPCLVLVGLAWLTMMTTLNAAAQTALPDWVRARGLAVFMIVFAGSMSGGAATWGLLADLTSTTIALTFAAIGAVVGTLFVSILPLGSTDSLRLTPSKHMPIHTYDIDYEQDTRLVQVLVSYDIEAGDQARFEHLMQDMKRWRLRTGAHSWYLYRDMDHPDRWVESFFIRSWTEHLRQHERATEDDKSIQLAVSALHRGGGKPHVAHLVEPRDFTEAASIR